MEATLATVPMPTDESPIQVEGNYSIVTEAGKNLALNLGFTLPHRAAEFDHPKLVRKVFKVLEFKHYWPNGGKSWTAHAGVELSVVIPRSSIEVVLEKTYSYPKIVVNGQTISLNVGGGGGGGWTDYIHSEASTSCNLPWKTVLALLEVALAPIVEESVPVNEKDRKDWIDAAAAKTVKIAPGMKINLDKYVINTEWDRTYVVHSRSKNGQQLLLKDADGKDQTIWRVGRNRIDWTRTAEANGIKIEMPKQFIRRGW